MNAVVCNLAFDHIKTGMSSTNATSKSTGNLIEGIHFA